MCSSDSRPSPSAFIENLRKPMPLTRKLLLLLRNSSIKIVRLRSCCGHYGEPGC